MANEAVKRDIDSSDRAEVDTYDRGIVPAETAARMEREGNTYKTLPTEERQLQMTKLIQKVYAPLTAILWTKKVC
jgi:phenylalanyl-tRNA synthetase beta subunit